MITLFRPPDEDPGEFDRLLDPDARPGSACVLDVAAGTAPAAVAQAAGEMLRDDQGGQLDLWVDGVPAGVITLPSLLPVLVSVRGATRGQGGRVGTPRERPATTRLDCPRCGAVLRLLGRPGGALRCPAGHPLPPASR